MPMERVGFRHTEKLDLQGVAKNADLEKVQRQLGFKEEENAELRKRISFLEAELDQRKSVAPAASTRMHACRMLALHCVTVL
jgi:hypothetical protein